MDGENPPKVSRNEQDMFIPVFDCNQGDVIAAYIEK